MIRNVVSYPTGGGFEVFFGTNDNGEFFMAATDWGYEDVLILDTDADAAGDDAFFEEWQNEHLVRELTGDEAKEFWGLIRAAE